MTDPRAIKKMHENKMKKMSESQLGMQIGACLNKAVDIVIGKIGTHTTKSEDILEWDDKAIKKDIIEWVDILFEIGRQKKIKEMEMPTPADMEDKWGEENFQEGEDKPLPTLDVNM